MRNERGICLDDFASPALLKHIVSLRTAFVQRILCTELLQRLMGFQPCLARAVALAAEVDCLISLAQVARDHGYCRPILTQDNVLRIKQGAAFGFEVLHRSVVCALCQTSHSHETGPLHEPAQP